MPPFVYLAGGVNLDSTKTRQNGLYEDCQDRINERLQWFGRMAEWLCRGLQILVQRFDSASGLQAISTRNFSRLTRAIGWAGTGQAPALSSLLQLASRCPARKLGIMHIDVEVLRVSLDVCDYIGRHRHTGRDLGR